MSECLTRSADRPERAHYGLAVYCAKRFFGRGVPREELIGEAEAALLWAAARSMPAGACASRPMPSPLCWVRCASYAGARGPCTCPAPRSVSSPRWKAPGGSSTPAKAASPPCGSWRRPWRGARLLGEMLAARDRMRRADGALDVQTASAPGEGFEDWVLLKDTLTRLPGPYAQCSGCALDKAGPRPGWPSASAWDSRRFRAGNARERNCSGRRWISTRPVRTCDPPQIPDLTTRRPVLQRTGAALCLQKAPH